MSSVIKREFTFTYHLSHPPDPYTFIPLTECTAGKTCEKESNNLKSFLIGWRSEMTYSGGKQVRQGCKTSLSKKLKTELEELIIKFSTGL